MHMFIQKCIYSMIIDYLEKDIVFSVKSMSYDCKTIVRDSSHQCIYCLIKRNKSKRITNQETNM